MERYRDPDSEEEKLNPFAEQESWEEHQKGKSSPKFGATIAAAAAIPTAATTILLSPEYQSKRMQRRTKKGAEKKITVT